VKADIADYEFYTAGNRVTLATEGGSGLFLEVHDTSDDFGDKPWKHEPVARELCKWLNVVADQQRKARPVPEPEYAIKSFASDFFSEPEGPDDWTVVK
jgi:hypothetical protein